VWGVPVGYRVGESVDEVEGAVGGKWRQRGRGGASFMPPQSTYLLVGRVCAAMIRPDRCR
jgi:hypothetical protein